jgi:hypothetical protein
MATPSLLASATPAQTGTWTVTYPNGNSRPFTTEWQAQAAQAVGGGEITYVPPAEPAAKSSTAATSSTAKKPAPIPRATSTTKKPAARKATTKRRPGTGTDAPVVDDNANSDGVPTVADGGDGGGGE